MHLNQTKSDLGPNPLLFLLQSNTEVIEIVRLELNPFQLIRSVAQQLLHVSGFHNEHEPVKHLLIN